MKAPAFFVSRLWRYGLVAFCAGLVLLGLVRLGVWSLGRPVLHPDVLRGPEILVWEGQTAGFGGISALVMAPDGLSLLAGGDRGDHMQAEITRGADGRITAIAPPVLTPISLASGQPPSRFKRDLEALSPMPDGRIAQAFEGFVRIELLDAPGARPTPLHRWDRFARFFGNRAFEALATLPDGRLLALTEWKNKQDQAFAVTYDGQAWQAAPRLPVPDGFAVTGADVGPDGCLYVVERRYGPASGFVTRVRRLRHAQGWRGETIYVTPPATAGNIEGLSSWQDDQGQVVLDLVADNNFWPLTPTRLIELRLAPGTDCTLAF